MTAFGLPVDDLVVPGEGNRSVLLAGWDGGGNVPPMLALGKRLLRHGHRVRLLGSESLAGAAAAAGLRFSPFTQARTWAPRPGEAIEDDFGAFALHLYGPETGTDLLAEAEADRPDVLVVDAMACGALSAAEHLGIPTAVLVHLRYRFFTEDYTAPWPPALERLNADRARLGLGTLPEGPGWRAELWRRAGRLFVTGLPELEGPGAAPAADARYAGLVADPDPQALPPAAAAFLRRHAAPVVVISLSTTYMHQEDQLVRTVAAADGLTAVVTAGWGAGQVAIRGSERMLVSRWLPHGPLLREADVVVTHGGYGTTMAALAAGVPLVCLPMGRDQPGNAAAVAALGAGISLAPDASPAEIRAAIDQVLGMPRRAAWDQAAPARPACPDHPGPAW